MGSLLRPQELLDVRAAIRDGQSPESSLKTVEEAAVKDVVALQRSLGFRAVTSGEFVRTRFWGLMWDEFEGTTRLQDAEAALFRLYHPLVPTFLSTSLGRLREQRPQVMSSQFPDGRPDAPLAFNPREKMDLRATDT